MLWQDMSYVAVSVANSKSVVIWLKFSLATRLGGVSIIAITARVCRPASQAPGRRYCSCIYHFKAVFGSGALTIFFPGYVLMINSLPFLFYVFDT